jgi:iron complex outermembrane receptor protein
MTAYHNVSLRYKFPTWTVQAGMRNVFDEQPPALSGNETFRTGYSALNAYDLLGRRVFVQVDKRF